MKIHTIHVTAGRGFNHPHEQYANFKFDLQLHAVLDPTIDDPALCLIELQNQAERAAEAHKKRILDDVKRLSLIQEGERTLAALRRKKKDQQDVEPQIAECEAALAKLMSEPLMLADKIIHPGHSDHPATSYGDADFDRDGD